MSTIANQNGTDSKKSVLYRNSEKNSEISKTFFENNDTIATFCDNVAESLKSLPSISSDSDTDSNISSDELREIEEFIKNSNRLRSISE